VSERLAGEISSALAPYVDIPLLPPEQKHELVKSVVSFLIVERADGGTILMDAARGSAKIAAVQGSKLVGLLSSLSVPERRRALVANVSDELWVPFMDDASKARLVEGAVESLAEAMLTRTPARALAKSASPYRVRHATQWRRPAR